MGVKRVATIHQRLAGERNYSKYHQIRMIEGHLLKMKQFWPSVRIGPVLVELDKLGEQIDKEWEEAKALLPPTKHPPKRNKWRALK